MPAARRIGAADDDLAEAVAACAIAEFHPNQQVRLVGLVSRADLNDSVGRLLSTRPTTEGRLHVELPDGSIVRAKPACLIAVVLPALADELWQHVFAQLLRWQRYALCGAVSKHWRAMSWRDASLWAQLIVVTKREYHPWRSLTLRTLPPICDGSLAGSDYEERDNIVQYLFNDYLPLLPTELCRMADAAWVRTLVLADPHGETDSWRHAQHEMESMLRLVQTVCARRYPGLRALRLPLQAIEYVPGPANPRWDDFREGVDAWRLEGRAALNKVLFPWLRELPEGLEWLAFDEGEGVGTSLHEFNSWLNLDKQAPPHLPRPPCTSTASPPHPHRTPGAAVPLLAAQLARHPPPRVDRLRHAPPRHRRAIQAVAAAQLVTRERSPKKEEGRHAPPGTPPHQPTRWLRRLRQLLRPRDRSSRTVPTRPFASP